MTHAIVSAALAVALLGSTTMAYAADHHRDTGGGARWGQSRGDDLRGEPFRGDRVRGLDIHSAVDRDHWHTGHWRHDWHRGRFGWWWIVDDGWSFYDEPVYPYPAYAYDEPPSVAGGNWYYCQSPRGYYPYVRSCNGPWQPIPAAPQP